MNTKRSNTLIYPQSISLNTHKFHINLWAKTNLLSSIQLMVRDMQIEIKVTSNFYMQNSKFIYYGLTQLPYSYNYRTITWVR